LKANQIEQTVLNKSTNLLIRTRIFENFSEIVRCQDCNAVVYEGLIPQQRFEEGLKMKQWQCGNGSCGHLNTVEMSLSCKKCQSPRPAETLPKDLIFPLYQPPNPANARNRRVTTMEKLLQIVPVLEGGVELKDKLEELLKKQKDREQDLKDFDKINIIEEFLGMRAKYILEA